MNGRPLMGEKESGCHMRALSIPYPRFGERNFLTLLNQSYLITVGLTMHDKSFLKKKKRNGKVSIERGL